MSLYTQSGYTQVSYGAPPYAQPGGYYQLPQATHYYPPVDATTFRRDYSARLAELTVNSRPIIQSLSMVAQEYIRFADIVAQCIEAHIRRVPPWMKLPAFYLLDAISKNVYEPYARHFAPLVSKLFLETYGQVDQSTRSKMEEMLLTWRTSGNGKELFGVVSQVAIERGVWGGGSTHIDHASGFYSGSGQISKSQVLSELEFTLGQKERALQSNPFDNTATHHRNILQQLRKLVEAGVSQDELRQILSQLRSISQAVAPPATLNPLPQPFAGPSSYVQSYPPQTSYSSPPAQHGGSSQHLQPKTETLDLQSLLSTSSNSSAAPVTEVAPISDISNILDFLLKAGVVSGTGTPTGAGETAKAEEKIPEIINPAKAAAREYRKMISSRKVKLTSASITKTKPMIVEILYQRLSAQCKQCGLRFADNNAGKQEMQDHLDIHFRQNRKANQNIGRGHSRSWFIGLEDWTHDSSANLKGKGREDGHRPLDTKAAAAAEIAKRDIDLRASYVVVPPGDEAKQISCPICKESIKSEFLEDDEDWVWRNAIKKGELVYHATCHAEAVVSTNSLAARRKHEMAGGSRSGTPDTHSARSTPPKHTAASSVIGSVRPSYSPSPQSKYAGTKRKIEINDPSITSEADGSPPMKKIAIESA